VADSISTHEGWYIRGNDGTADWQRGPYPWTDLVTFARDGRLQPHNLVWHAARPEWHPASSVPGLFAVLPPAVPAEMTPVVPAAAAAPTAPAPAPAPVVAPVTPTAVSAPAPAIPAAPTGPAATTPTRRKPGKVVAIVLLALVLVVAIGAGAWALLFRDGGPAASGPSMGVAETALPDRATLIATEEWGEVPASQVIIVLNEGAERSDAERVAAELGGSVVGEVAFVNLYQIEFPGATEDDLRAAIAAAEGDDAVDYAYPNSEIQLDEEIWGIRSDPYSDPAYAGDAGAGYAAIGVSRAWAYIRGSGADLSPVHVGIVDDGLYRPGSGGESEFGGDVNIGFPDPDAGELSAPNTENTSGGTTASPSGSHGTAVATIIGANANNTGASGIAAPLGSNLTMSMINQYSGKYGDKVTTEDPDDPTKQVWYDGKSYSVGALVAITKQIEAGATIINCSWGNVNADPRDVETYRRFFTKMADEHPDVLFVCSAGNTGTALDGSKRYPSGLSLPNMITVGALDNDGQTATYSSKSSDNYEVTLATPATGAVVGVNANGTAVREDGTSFAAPQVAAAAAILRSVNPDLTAGQIKDILVSTARTTYPSASGDDDSARTVSDDVGGRVLAVDAAVLQVINDQRESEGLDPIDAEWLEALGIIDAVAVTGDIGAYTVRGIITAAGEDGAELEITVSGEDAEIEGDSVQTLSEAGEVEWNVSLPEDKGVITVTRLDTGAKSVITIDKIDINGTWTGTFTFTSITITDEQAAEDQGCSMALLQDLVGKPIPMTLDVSVDEEGQGTAVMVLDASAIDENATSDPSTLGISYSGRTIAFDVSEASGISAMVATVSRNGTQLAMKGSIDGGGPGYAISASFALGKADTDQ